MAKGAEDYRHRLKKTMLMHKVERFQFFLTVERNFQLLYLSVCLCNITIIYNYLTNIKGYKANSQYETMREDNNKIILASISCLTINRMSAPQSCQCANNKTVMKC